MLLYTKYYSSRLCGFREEDFFKFSYIFQCKKLTPGAGSFLTPGGLFQQHLWRTSRCCPIPNMKALGHVVSEKKIFKSFPIYFNVKLLTPGAGPFLTPGGFNNKCGGPLDVAIYQKRKL